MRRLLAPIAFLLASAAAPAPPSGSVPAPAPAAAPAAATSPVWASADAQALLAYVEQIGAEGLDSADYAPAKLRAAIASGDVGPTATETFLHLATDLRQGHVRGGYRIAWHIPDPPIDRAGQLAMLQQALSGHMVRETLNGLLPAASEYAALRDALAKTPPKDRATRLALRANLERWRWMPRDLGPRYLLVNVAGFELDLVENGKVVDRHKLIVGKVSTPTPQFATRATGLILNPWWDVPGSIVAESVGRLVRTNPAGARAKGYVWGGGGIRQAPGPGNSLGQMKLVMPNPFTVYIHDTPSKPLFDESVRAFSHGCIRTQDPFGLAERLLAGVPGWDQARIGRVVASRVSTKVDLAQPVPVYVAYFTAATDGSGAVKLHPDIYGRDKAVVAELTDREVMSDGGE
jgi:murein L,D-transpeptidase YcbB/YkuD